MTDCASSTCASSTRTARAGGRSLAHAGALVLLALLPLPTRAQTPTWEAMPLIPDRSGYSVGALDFLRGEGAAAADPAADTLVWFSQYGPLLYNPSGAAGAAGDNGPWGMWHFLCPDTAQCGIIPGIGDGLVTDAGTMLTGGTNRQISRGINRGRSWRIGIDDIYPVPFLESALPALRGLDGYPMLLAAVSDDGLTARSFDDGAPGTWTRVGTGPGFPQSFGEVPPSPALPDGRILMGVWNGILTSDDGGLSYAPSSAYGFARYIVWSFTFRAEAGHPYGGVVYAGVQNLNAAEGGGEGRGAEVLRSEDGGRTWTRAHRFSAAEMEVPVPANTDVSEVAVLATPDGALWAGVRQSGGSSNPRRGGVMRSEDGGATWSRADAGYRTAEGWGYGAGRLVLSRTGVLYAATDRGVWRTTASVVGAESGPAEASGLGVAVRPNPASGRVAVRLTLDAAAEVRVSVVDALGREVAVVLDGPQPAGETVASVETGAWPVGLYVVRASSGARHVSARLIVAR